MDLSRLVECAQRGDLDAFTSIVDRLQGMGLGYAYSILGDTHLAEDAVQDAFLQAYVSMPDLKEPVAFPAWFRRIIYKYCDRIHRARRPSVPLEEEAWVTSDEDPREAIEKQEESDQIWRVLQLLPEEERHAVILFHMSGYSRKGIAAFLEVSLETVIHRLRSGRSRFKKEMARMSKPDKNVPSAKQDGEKALSRIDAAESESELAYHLGMLKRRISMGQSVLQHSLDVAHLSGRLAAKVGLDEDLAKRAGLLHDIGKSVGKIEAPHTRLGEKLAEDWGEHPVVRHVVATHHEKNEDLSSYSFVVKAADYVASTQFPSGMEQDDAEEVARQFQALDDAVASANGLKDAYSLEVCGEVWVLARGAQNEDDPDANVGERIKGELDGDRKVRVTVSAE